MANILVEKLKNYLSCYTWQ